MVGRFALLSAAAVLVLGIALAHTLQGQIRTRALDNGAQSADLIARFGFQPQLVGADLRRPLAVEARDALDGLLRAGYASRDLEAVSIYGPNGRVVYSTEKDLIGRYLDNPGHAAALRGGHMTEVEQSGDHKVIDADVPLYLDGGGAPAGELETRMNYGPAAAAIRRDTRRVYLVVSLGLLALWAALYRIAVGASRELRRQSARNAYQARHDTLTGLPNRQAFYEAVEDAVAPRGEAVRASAVMIIDLDRFKEVNDTLGHHSGDLLLGQAAERLRGAVRKSDVLARLGGDEFALLVPAIESEDDATTAAGWIRTALEQPFEIQDMTVHVGASVGIAIAPEHGHSAQELLQRADVAMYMAKGAGAGHEVYDPSADPYTASKLAMVGDLRRALADGQLEVHYQPKAVLASGKVDGVEALVRWNHPERGLVPPNDFIPLAEHTGLINPLTAYVLDEALRQSAEWRGIGIKLTVAVNLSARNIADPCFPDTVAEMLARHGVEPCGLVLELTESMLMADPAQAKAVLARLNEMGVGLAIDDFGTGYSSLAYLSELPVTELKIDRSFVMSMATSDDDAFIVRATIDLGHNLGLRVVAEGVETEAVWSRLAELGCDLGQGYYLSRPVPATEITRWLVAVESTRPSPAEQQPAH